MPPKSENQPHRANIVMWGAPGCGKTTFLAALSIALNRRRNGWKVIGADTASTNALIALTTRLASDQTFPRASEARLEHYRWRLVGETTRRAIRWWPFKKVRQMVQVGLDLADLSGEGYSPRGPIRSELVDNLVNSRGIIFLFDPVREFDSGDAFDYLFGVLSHLSQRMLDHPDFEIGKLPHHLAICITKFDDFRVLETAEKMDLIQVDPDDPLEFPTVTSDDARELFEKLCEISSSGNADMVINTLEQYFRPERIQYFVTSAIGFHVDPLVGVYDPGDFENIVPDASGLLRIRSTVNPINVMEPLLWLGRMLPPETTNRGSR